MGRHAEGSLCAVQSHPAPALPCPPQVPASLEDDQVVSWKGVRLTQAHCSCSRPARAPADRRLLLATSAAATQAAPAAPLVHRLVPADAAASTTTVTSTNPSRLPAQVLLSDILPTAWHSCELGEVGPGDRVAIWGTGPGELYC